MTAEFWIANAIYFKFINVFFVRLCKFPFSLPRDESLWGIYRIRKFYCSMMKETNALLC